MKTSNILSIVLSLSLIAPHAYAADDYNPKMDAAAKKVKTDMKAFAPDPTFPDKPYSAEEQLKIYGGKYPNDPPWFLHIFGRGLYEAGQLSEGINLVGRKNLLHPHLHGFGDVRLAYANIDLGPNGNQLSEVALRINLDLDLKLTSTERFHAFVRPTDKNNQFTRVLFDNGKSEYEEHFDFNLDALFFEGDVGWIWTGISDEYAKFDLPFAFGLMPILFHNGIWLNDIFTGAAFTFPAKNSPMFDISNMDFTIFYGNDELDTPLAGNGNDVNDQKIYGFNWFVEWFEGYTELGYAFTEDETKFNSSDQSYHNMMLSHSWRWGNTASLSFRALGNFGQNDNVKTADGYALFLETSWMTHLPYTLVPYFNMFYGKDKPAKVVGADLLTNTGLVFEADGVNTAFPTLKNDALDTAGASLGIEYLFNLDRQIVFEVSTVQDHSGAKKHEYGAGLRFQQPLNDTVILRVDAIAGFKDKEDNVFGGRTELRWKF